MKLKITQLYNNPNFNIIKETRETTTFQTLTPIQPNITIDKKQYQLNTPITQITIINNHILQTHELELENKEKEKLLHINLDNKLEDTLIEYNTTQKQEEEEGVEK